MRIVAATNESLEEKVEEGSFRRDLCYRLNTLPIQIPPLSQRGDDVFLLIGHFRDELGGRFALDEPVRRFMIEEVGLGGIFIGAPGAGGGRHLAPRRPPACTSAATPLPP